mmetsp:Transcript_6243/g.16102  ORF Transcript_6243/g.16102 Transcript_6243/m.16102 type:complete len:421 (-) Transcript_6243:151-1413(-)
MPLAMSPVLSARAPTPRLARPATASRRPASVGSRVAARREWLPRWAPRAMATDAAEVGGSPDEDGEEKAAAEGPQRPVVAAAAEKEAAGQTEEANGTKAPKERKQKEVIEELPFKVGDTVWGTFASSSTGGARIKICTGDIEGLWGFMPEKEGPYSGPTKAGKFRPHKGLKREFLVCKIPDTVEKDGFGPLLSARLHDEDLLWHRLQQMQDACRADFATFEVPVLGTNPGGLRIVTQGIHGFVPFSQLPKAEDAEWWTQESAEAAYHGKKVQITIRELVRDKRKLVGSIKEGLHFDTMKSIAPGKVVTGKVWKVMPFGCMVGIDNTNLSGLLHISAVSHSHLREMEDVLQIGDAVTAVVHDMENDWGRISLACKDLERFDGEMLTDKEACFRDADKTMAELLQKLNSATGGTFDEDDGYY